MAKKSNKTEQVLKLITRDDQELEGMQTEDQDMDEKVEETSSPSKEDPQNLEKVKGDFAREQLVNLTEHLVKEKAVEIMRKLNVCSCHTCSQDVLALALNSLDNRFVTTNAGKLHVQLEFYKKQYETDIIAALTKACVRVKVSPRHEK